MLARLVPAVHDPPSFGHLCRSLTLIPALFTDGWGHKLRHTHAKSLAAAPFVLWSHDGVAFEGVRHLIQDLSGLRGDSK